MDPKTSTPNYYTTKAHSHTQVNCSHSPRWVLTFADRKDCAPCGSRKLTGATAWEYLKPAALDYYLQGEDWRYDAMKAEANA